tara:strand:+ start:209 stop:475 length:267 start_codon:yes stop_codon:yes gene_type:complete
MAEVNLGAVMSAMTRPLDIEDAVKEYGKVTVQLVGEDGNSFSIMGRVSLALRRAGWPPEKIKLVKDEMMSSDYDHLLRTALTVCKEEK